MDGPKTKPVPIDKNIPIPDKRRVGRPSKYPWSLMEVGDSFLHAGPKSVAAAATSRENKRFADRHFEWRQTEEGIRIWRTK